MCEGCAIAAMAGASVVRSWLQARDPIWLAPPRTRFTTVTLFVSPALVS
jgi:hypothetical protein